MFHWTAISLYEGGLISQTDLEKTYDIFDSLSFNAFKEVVDTLNKRCLGTSYEEYFNLKISSKYGIIVFTVCYAEGQESMNKFSSKLFNSFSAYENIDTIFFINLNPVLCNETILEFTRKTLQ
jgi:hypothetical protein